jgi:hypothetical protein
MNYKLFILEIVMMLNLRYLLMEQTLNLQEINQLKLNDKNMKKISIILLVLLISIPVFASDYLVRQEVIKVISNGRGYASLTQGQKDELSLYVSIWDESNNQSELGMGGFNYVAGQQYKLAGSGISSSATSITLQSFTQPVSGIELVMTDFGDIGYGTLEPGKSKKEFISFTGISQSGSDTKATLTGVTRGLGFVSPYTASTTLQQSHSGGSKFIISNSPQFHAKQAGLTNSESVTGLWTFNTVLPTTSLTPTTTTQFTPKTYVDNVANQGAATSTESLGGIVELATQTEMASTTDLGAERPLVLQAKYATSTGQVDGLYIPITENDGYLNQNFIDLTESYTWTGQHNFDAATTTFSSATTTLDGTDPKFRVGTTSPNATMAVGGELIADTFNAVSSASSTIQNLQVVNNATSSTITTSTLTISEVCIGCRNIASTTNVSLASGNTDYAEGASTTDAALFDWRVDDNATEDTRGQNWIYKDTFTTTVIGGEQNAGLDFFKYTMVWSGTDINITENVDTNGDATLTGQIYWFK